MATKTPQEMELLQTMTPLLGDEEGRQQPQIVKMSAQDPVAPLKGDVCTNALGEFGWWQLRAILLVSLVKVPSAWQMASILFTAPTPGEFWCARPKQFQDWDSHRWRQFIHPPLGHNSSGDIRDHCNVYDVGLEMLATWSKNSEEIPFNTSVRKCDSYEFSDNATTVVTQWNLVCQRQVLVSVSQFFYLLGILVGGVLCTVLLNRFSPRRIILLAMITQVIAGISVALAPQFELQVSLRFITAAACANMFTSGYIICTDITGGRWRVITGACYEHMWSLGVVTLATLGYLLRNWSQLQLAISVPTIFVLVTNVWIPDSPRWLISKGRGAEAKLILQKGAKFNGRNTSVPDIPTPSIERKKTDTRWIELFDKPANTWNCLAMHVVWAVTIVTYYGALLNVKNVGKHLYFNTVIAAFAEVAGVLLGLVLMLWCRRKWTALGIILVVGGGACVASWLQPSQEEWPREWVMLSLAMAGRVAIATSLTLLQVTSSELLPEHHRQMGIFSCVTVARVFLLSAPFIGSLAMYGDCVSLSSFGGITVIGGIAALFLDKSQCKSSQSGQIRENIQNVWSTEKFNDLNRSKVVELPEQNFGKFNRNVDQGV